MRMPTPAKTGDTLGTFLAAFFILFLVVVAMVAVGAYVHLIWRLFLVGWGMG
jgi:hypothetical protein